MGRLPFKFVGMPVVQRPRDATAKEPPTSTIRTQRFILAYKAETGTSNKRPEAGGRDRHPCWQLRPREVYRIGSSRRVSILGGGGEEA